MEHRLGKKGRGPSDMQVVDRRVLSQRGRDKTDMDEVRVDDLHGLSALSANSVYRCQDPCVEGQR
jgi:hypothetical protein